ncbi:hypothetical protein HDU98_003416 [Podochytrium sp. JEL0797]|nr:hypothetical protein HDU98_003416 [Podochytrium sp. JEL0797]
MAGTTSKGIGRHDLHDHYTFLLSSKNPSEKLMRSTLRTLRHLILTQGIPHSPAPLGPQNLRARVWKLLLGVYRTSADEYVGLVGKGPSGVFEKIKNDAFRTLMGDKGFGKVVDEGVIVRVLNAFAWRAKDYPTSRLINLQFSYVQGMNVLAAPFLYVMPELDAFYTFATFIHHTCPLYVQPALEGVHCGIKLLDKCLMIADAPLHAFLKSKNLDPVMYAFPSVMTFSACTPPLNEVLRLWDFLLSYGVHMNLICIVAQLVLMRTEILKSPSPMKVLRTFPKLDAKKVVAMSMKLVELIPDSLYDLLVRHVFDAMFSKMSSQDQLAQTKAAEGASPATLSPAVSDTSIPTTPSGTKRRVTKCNFGCGAAAVKTIGTCRYCSSQYCAKHRLPEAHACANLQTCQSAAKDRLEKRLIGEKTVGAKIATA